MKNKEETCSKGWKSCGCKECSAQRLVYLVTRAPDFVQCTACEGSGDVYTHAHRFGRYEVCTKCGGHGEVERAR